MFKKNDIININITDISVEGMGIGKAQNFAFFVAGTAPGDEIEMRVVKLKKNYGYGIVERLIKPSALRVEAPCPNFGKCGGCALQHISYDAQLKFKENAVKNNLIRIGGLPKGLKVNSAIGMDLPYNYRNKGQYPVSSKNGKAVVGFYAPRSHNVIPLSNCPISSPTDAPILKIITDFMNEFDVPAYNEQTKTGLVRHILIRTGFKTNQIMVCIVVNGNSIPHKAELVLRLKAAENITTALLNVNTRFTNVILGTKNIILFGAGFIEDYIDDLKFKISPLSFFQVNPVQTEKLYKKALSLLELTGNETVFDICCGIGTISLFLAKRAKQVYGIEIVPQAVRDARQNASDNNITNVTFLEGAAEEVCPKLAAQGITADVAVIDPPRKGCATVLLDTLIQMAPAQIVYISCNPSTLARDIQYLLTAAPTYQMQLPPTPVDMFPHTPHVETVVLMSRVEK